tara:strand:- start:11616 stop:12269 length:654 start_codon:yes stop_codon:yes gene_type:complete
MERNFKGIWIPRDIWLREDISVQGKVFLAEIDSLDNEMGCMASNAYFARFFGISKSRVSAVITELSKKGLVNVKLTYTDKGNVDRRYLELVSKFDKPLYESDAKPVKKVETETPNDLLAKEVIDYLNSKADKNFKCVGANKGFIIGRISEDYGLKDFKHVVDVKVEQWLRDSTMNKFLRPNTLFSPTNFGNYMCEKSAKLITKSDDDVVQSQTSFYD